MCLKLLWLIMKTISKTRWHNINYRNRQQIITNTGKRGLEPANRSGKDLVCDDPCGPG